MKIIVHYSEYSDTIKKVEIPIDENQTKYLEFVDKVTESEIENEKNEGEDDNAEEEPETVISHSETIEILQVKYEDESLTLDVTNEMTRKELRDYIRILQRLLKQMRA